MHTFTANLQSLPANLELVLALAALAHTFEVEAFLALGATDFHEIFVLFGEFGEVLAEFIKHVLLLLSDFDFTQIGQQPLKLNNQSQTEKQ